MKYKYFFMKGPISDYISIHIRKRNFILHVHDVHTVRQICNHFSLLNTLKLSKLLRKYGRGGGRWRRGREIERGGGGEG